MAECKKKSKKQEDCEGSELKGDDGGKGKKSSVKDSAAANDLVRKLSANLTRRSPAQQLILGSVSGWTTGFLLMKVGRTTAFIVGGGIIISQVAHQAGYGNMDWNNLKERAKQATTQLDTKYNKTPPEWLKRAKKYSRSNPCFAAGFVGGFLIGVVS